MYQVLVAGQLFSAYGPASVNAAGGDTNFGAHPKLPAIGKLRRRIV